MLGEVKRVSVDELLEMFPDCIRGINAGIKIMQTYKVPSKKEVRVILNTADIFPLYFSHLQKASTWSLKVDVPPFLQPYFVGGSVTKPGVMVDFLMSRAELFMQLYVQSEPALIALKRKWVGEAKVKNKSELSQLIDEMAGNRAPEPQKRKRAPTQVKRVVPAPPPPLTPPSPISMGSGQFDGKLPEAVYAEPKMSGTYTEWNFGGELGVIRVKNNHIRAMYRGLEPDDIKIWLEESKKAKASGDGIMVGYMMLNEEMKKYFHLNTLKVPIYIPWKRLIYGCIFVGQKRRGKTVLLISMISQANFPKQQGSRSPFPKSLVIFDPKPDFNPAQFPYRQSLIPATADLKRNMKPNEILFAPLGRPRPAGKTLAGSRSYRPLPSPSVWKRCLPLMLNLEDTGMKRIYTERFKTFLETVGKPMSVTELLMAWSKSPYHAQMKQTSVDSIDSALRSLLSKTYLFAPEDYSKPANMRTLVNYTPKELCYPMNQMGYRFAMSSVIRMADKLEGGRTMSARLGRHEIAHFTTAVIGEVIDYVMANKIEPPIIVVEEAQQALNTGAPVSLLCKDLIRTHGNLGIPLFFVLQQISASDFQIDKDLLGAIPARIFFTIDLNDEKNVQDKFGYAPDVTDAMKRLPPGTFFLDVVEMPRIPLITGDLGWVTKTYYGGTRL